MPTRTPKRGDPVSGAPTGWRQSIASLSAHAPFGAPEPPRAPKKEPPPTRGDFAIHGSCEIEAAARTSQNSPSAKTPLRRSSATRGSAPRSGKPPGNVATLQGAAAVSLCRLLEAHNRHNARRHPEKHGGRRSCHNRCHSTAPPSAKPPGYALRDTDCATNSHRLPPLADSLRK